MEPEKVVGPFGTYLWPWPHPAIVMDPPARAVPPLFCTATGTLLSTTFSMMTLPALAGCEFVVHGVLMPIGVLVMVLSINVMEPVSMLPLPPALISIPTWQLLIVMLL